MSHTSNSHTFGFFLLALLVTAIAALVYYAWHRARERRHRAEYIARYLFPRQLASKVAAKYPTLTASQVRQVLEGLRQFFLACLAAEGHRVAKHVGMPSVAVDEAWHEFILMTRDYAQFCTRAFGRYLHHAPSGQTEEPEEKSLANTLHQLRSGSPDPSAQWAMLGAVPMLFALDQQLGIPGGRVFDLDEMNRLESQRRLASATTVDSGSSMFSCGGSTSCDSSGSGCDSGGASCGGSSCGGSGCGSS